ncbi:glycosyltransferase family 2 protein [Mycoplasmoides alvi]|uniref:glycosyltransferase family 2 protein n=1 Tax=Mycoplasmoides alvi TaxID=78580 RepID=UPI0006975B30|nr:glycosyltransferase family 2 protein [Mycoplasmoides alvi]
MQNSFSVIIPYYNTNIQYTRFCLESILNQDLYLLKEIIVINDGSDLDKEIDLVCLVSELNDKYKRSIIKLIHQTNKGVILARKKGVEEAKGNIILFVDPDDWICDKNALTKLNDLFISNDVDLINFQCVSSFEEVTEFKQPKIKNKLKVFDLNWYFNENFKPGTPVTLWIYAYKKSILVDQVMWNSMKMPFDDFYFNSILLSKKLKGLCTNQFLYGYRKNSINSITYHSSKLDIKKRISIFSKWFTTFSDWNIWRSYDCYEYWVSTFIENAVSSIGFRNLIKLCQKNNINCPELQEMKNFIKKYKFYSGLRWIYMNLCINFSFLDYLLPKFYKHINNFG